MKYAPIIHSRTYNCDFNAQLAVHPLDYGTDDIKAIREYILTATSDVDFMNGVRRVAFRYKGDIIAGMVGYLDDIRENDASDEALNFIRDVKKRKIFAFIGIAIRDINGMDNLPNVTKSILWEIFKTNMVSQWMSKTSQSISAEFKEWADEKYCGDSASINWNKVGNIYLFEVSSDVQEDTIFHNMLREIAAKKKNSFCSNLNSKDAIRKNKFEYVTTTQKIIDAIKKEVSKNIHSEKHSTHQADSYNNNNNTSKCAPKSGTGEKNNSLTNEQKCSRGDVSNINNDHNTSVDEILEIKGVKYKVCCKGFIKCIFKTVINHIRDIVSGNTNPKILLLEEMKE